MPPPAHPPPQFGTWERGPDSKYWYNKHLRWYYDDKSGFYYGGEPPGWTQQPAIPDGARFEKLHKDAGSGALAALSCLGIALHVRHWSCQSSMLPFPWRHAARSPGNCTLSTRRGSSMHTLVCMLWRMCAGTAKTVVRGTLPQQIANLGGHRAPVDGQYTRGVLLPEDAAKAQEARQAAAKRAREEAAKSNEEGLSEKEREERKRREAARQRVEARTAAAFGLG